MRGAVGVKTVGLEKSAQSMNMFFECANIDAAHDKGPVLMFHILRREVGSLLTTIDGGDALCNRRLPFRLSDRGLCRLLKKYPNPNNEGDENDTDD